MSATIVLLVSFCYLALLFVVAWLGDRHAMRHPLVAGRIAQRKPVIYALSLTVYCTSWTFYGSVGLAATNGLEFLPVYMGPIAAMLLGWPVLNKILLVAKAQNITSIADFIASRYGKSVFLGGLVTVIAVVGTMPYIALQLKALSTTYDLLTSNHQLITDTGGATPIWQDTSVIIAGLMAVFAILFGTRHIDTTEHHQGLMLVLAIEAVVKLTAFLAVGLFVSLFLFDGIEDILAKATSLPNYAEIFADGPVEPRWWTITFLALLATICLPRQFHVAVVENTSNEDVRTAVWMFPLYLLLINIFVLPIALGGNLLIGDSNSDHYVLSLPLVSGNSNLALLAFVGGLSAATSMVIVATVTLSTMICNDLVVPMVLAVMRYRRRRRQADLGAWLLITRRLAILLVLGLSYAYYRTLDEGYGLVSIGLLSFAAMAQFAPALLIGLYWKGGTRIGALLGLTAGFAAWFYTLMLPTMSQSFMIGEDLVQHGLLGLSFLRPQAMFGLGYLDPLTHGVVVSLGLNLLLYLGGSWYRLPKARERIQADAFVEAAPRPDPKKPIGASATVGDLIAMTGRYLGQERAEAAFRLYFDGQSRALVENARADIEVLRLTERILSGSIGGSSARVVLASMLEGRNLDEEDLKTILADVSRAVEHSQDLLQTTFNTIAQGIAVFNTDHHLVQWNRQYLELLQLPKHLAREGTPLERIVMHNAQRGDYGHVDVMNFVRDRLKVIDRSVPQRYERRLWNGRFLEVRSTPMPDGGFVTTFTDITQIRQAQEMLERRVEERTADLRQANHDLENAKAEAERANSSKTRFLAAASHDLLQPLNAARLFTSALEQKDLEDTDTGLVQKIGTSLHSVEELLGSLLDISKLDAGGMVAERAVFALDDIFSKLEDEFGAIAADHGLELRVVRTGLYVDSDPKLLRRILQNFISNALRYTKTGKVLVGARRKGADLQLQVWDSGPGIEWEKQKIIFEEFRRLNATDSRDEKSLGLGLAIVERMANLLGHQIGVASIPGKGSMFHVSVPVKAQTSLSAPVPQKLNPANNRFGDLSILCIDNERDILEGLEALLATWGIDTRLAQTLEESVACAKERMPDVILADYHLDDGVTGFDAVDAVQDALGQHIPTILVTAERGEDLRLRCNERDWFLLNKPVKPARLRSLLGRMTRPVAAE